MSSGNQIETWISLFEDLQNWLTPIHMTTNGPLIRELTVQTLSALSMDHDTQLPASQLLSIVNEFSALRKKINSVKDS
jgi:hypothetical protein